MTAPPAPPLLDWQFELDGKIRFGLGTNVRVYDFVPATQIREADLDRANADGIRFGRDFLGGTELAFELGIVGDSPADALNRFHRMRAAWNDQAVRTTTGAMQALTMKRPHRGGVETLYGRGRDFEPGSMNEVGVSYIPVAATFILAEPVVYGPEQQVRVDLVPPDVGGVTLPCTIPRQFVGTSMNHGLVHIGGSEPSWLVLEVHGPISNPVVQVTGQWNVELLTSLAFDRWVTVDPRPASRSVELDDGTNLAGKLTARSRRLSQIRLGPGDHEVLLRGTDPTGSSYLLVRWSDTDPM